MTSSGTDLPGRGSDIPAARIPETRRGWLARALLVPGLLRVARSGPRTTPAGEQPLPRSPALQVHTDDGTTIDIHRLTGKVVLIDFMTTTCPSCRQASAGVERLYREFGGRGFLPVAVAIDPQGLLVLPMYRNLLQLTFPLGVVAREEVLRYLNHAANKPMMVPTLVLLDKRGRVWKKQVGWPGEDALRGEIGQLLGQNTAGRTKQ